MCLCALYDTAFGFLSLLYRLAVCEELLYVQLPMLAKQTMQHMEMKLERRGHLESALTQALNTQHVLCRALQLLP